MSQASRPAARIEIVDPIWERIRTEADAIVQSDLAMAGFVVEAVLEHSSLEEAVIARVASRLDHAALRANKI